MKCQTWTEKRFIFKCRRRWNPPRWVMKVKQNKKEKKNSTRFSFPPLATLVAKKKPSWLDFFFFEFKAQNGIIAGPNESRAKEVKQNEDAAHEDQDAEVGGEFFFFEMSGHFEGLILKHPFASNLEFISL